MIGPGGRVIEDFAEAKQYALDWLRAPRQVDSRGEDYPLDANVVPLVRKMNERLPFLFTWGSCGGHFYSRKDILARYPGVPEDELALPIEGYVACYGGEMCFEVDGSEASERFLRRVGEMLAVHPDAGLFRSNPARRAYILRFTRAHVTEDPDACTEAEAVVAKREIVLLMEKLSELCNEFA